MKEAYYFSHDGNARHDPKITAMRGVYGMEGYGWFWALVEMMRESDGFKLDMRPKYAFNAFASEMQCEIEKAQEFIKDCIDEFGLFLSDGNYFWSDSLMRRMKRKQEISEKARRSAEARWGKKSESDQGVTGSDDEVENEDECERMGNECESDALKESKGNEIKNNKKSTRQRKTYAEDSSPFLMARYLHEKIMGYASSLGVAHLVQDANLQNWADDCRKILELDNRDRGEVFRIINWFSTNDFWQSKILSPRNFRKQYKQLCIQMASSQKKGNQASSKSNSFTDKNQQQKEKIKELLERGGSGSKAIIPDNL